MYPGFQLLNGDEQAILLGYDFFEMWDLRNNKQLWHRQCPGLASLAARPDGSEFLTYTGKALAICGPKGQEIRTLLSATGPDIDHIPTVVAFIPSTKNKAVSAGEAGDLVLWDCATGEILGQWRQRIPGLDRDPISAIAVSSNGKSALTGSTNGSLLIHDLNSKRAIRTLLAHPRQSSPPER
jgi:WD40 repeat protein